MIDVKIKFVDFWPGFQPETFYPYKMLLKTEYNIIIDEVNPDIVIGSVFGNQIYNWSNKIRIIYTGENIKPDFNKCDYFMGYDNLTDERVLRLPIYQLHWGNAQPEERQYLFDKKLTPNRNKFCAFIHSNPNAPKRNEFLFKLSNYKKVDSGGMAFNNIGYKVENKIEWLKDYKLCMCFENFSEYGYLTEKLLEGMMGGCIPIYWGSESCKDEFNPKSFLNWHDYNNDDLLINKIIELDQNDDLYEKMYSEPYLIDNKENIYMDDNRVVDFLRMIIEKNVHI
jgi:hypothetical protein